MPAARGLSGYGKTSDNVIGLEMITGSGEHVTLNGAAES